MGFHKCLCDCRQIFEDDSKALSSLRIMSFITVFMVLLTWFIGNIQAGTYIPLGFYEYLLIASALGFKVWQAKYEYGDK